MGDGIDETAYICEDAAARGRWPASANGASAMPAADSRSRSSSPYAVEQMAVSMPAPGSARGGAGARNCRLLAAGRPRSAAAGGGSAPGSGRCSILAALVLVAALVPHPRRSLLLARFWVLFTRHRLQRSFWELRLHTRAGRLPLVLWISSTPVGVRAWVLLRAGMTFEDFEESAAAFATACGAADCRVTASARSAWLAVHRRDPHVTRSARPA